MYRAGKGARDRGHRSSHSSKKGCYAALVALTLRNAEAERLAAEIANLTGETKTEAVRRALSERRERLGRTHGEAVARAERFHRYLEREVWPHVPPDQLGRRLTKEEEEELLGYEPGEM